ncbi:MAG: hypothetical protein ACW960_15510, partial [Candidatus Thorarchaeota archaeon]
MRKSRSGRLLPLSCVTLIIAFLITAPTVYADTVLLDDNFNDGDYAGWTVRNGAFSAATFELVGTGANPTQNYITIPVAGLNSMGDLSSSVEYVWEFDLSLDGNAWSEVAIFTEDEEYAMGSGVSLIFTPTLSGLGRHAGLGRGNAVEIGVISVVFVTGDWHFKVKQNETNHFYVWVDDVLQVDGVSMLEDVTYGYFGFNADEGASMDNITINEVDVTTPTPTPTPTPT